MARNDLPAESHGSFSVSLLTASQEVYDYISWRLWDPLVLAAGIPTICPDTRDSCDLLIVGERLPEQGQSAYETYRERSYDDFLKALDGAKSIIAVQPAVLGESLHELIATRCAIDFQQWHYETPRQSRATGHPLGDLSRQLKRLPDNFHITFDWHMAIDAPPENVVTRLSSGMPDVVQNDRDCCIASNLFSDLLFHTRHPDYKEYEASISALLVSLARSALGEESILPSSIEDYDNLRLVFYGYGFARKFVTELITLKGENPVASEDLIAADNLVADAACQLLAGKLQEATGLLSKAGDNLTKARQALTQVEPYFVRGWHGGLLVDRMEGGEILGYAEWGWPSFAMRWAEDRLYSAEHKSTPTVNQVCGNTWDLIADYGITDLEHWKKASAAGLVETVKGMYSDAYLEVLGTESNLRQFEYGIRALARMGGTSQIFAVAFDDFAFHPQLPQILKGFGFEGAVLRCGGPGQIIGVDKETLVWKGLNGSLVPAIPKYESIPNFEMGIYRPGGFEGGINVMARQLAAADEAGFSTVLGGGIQDHTMPMLGEYEWEAFNTVAKVQATPTTYADYLKAVPPKGEPRYYNADELLGRPFNWSGYGSLNQMAREDRMAERLLVTAEMFSAIACFSGKAYPTDEFERAWKDLLSSQDHFAYGCGGPDNPEGYQASGLQQPFIPDYPGPLTPITLESVSQGWKANVIQTARKALDKSLSYLISKEVSTDPGKAPQVLVYNACNWDRQGEVQCWIVGSVEDILLVDDGENQSPAVVLRESGHGDNRRSLVSFQANVSSLGLRVFTIRSVDKDNGAVSCGHASPEVLENPFVRVLVDPDTGGINSIVDKSSSEKLFRDGEQAKFLCTQPGLDSSKTKAAVTWERSDSIAQCLLVTGKFANCPYRLRLSLPQDSRVLEMDLEIDYGSGAIFGHKTHLDTLLRHIFPFKPSKKRWINLPFGVYETEVENPVALDFLDLEFGGHGVALLNDGVPGLFIPDEDVSLLISDGVPPLRGVHRYRYGIYAHTGDWREAGVPWKAWEFQQPLGAKIIEDHTLSLPFSRSYLQTTGNAVLSGLHVQDGKPRARFYDTTGSSSKVDASWHFPWSETVETTMDGRDPRAVPAKENSVQINLPAWGIVTLGGKEVQQGGDS